MEGEGGEMDGVLVGGWGLFYNLTFSPLTADKKKWYNIYHLGRKKAELIL